MQIRKALAAMAGFVTLLGGGGLAAMEPDPAPVVATWKEAEIDFTYIGRTSFYTCESLRQKVARILQAAGARDDLVVRSSGCFGASEIDTFTRVRIRSWVADRPHSPADGSLWCSTSRLSSSAPIQGCIFSSSVPGR